jgi:phospholipase D3/4
MTNFEMDLLDTRVNNHPSDKDVGEGCCHNSLIKPACLPITIVAVLLMITFLMPLFNDDLEMGMKFEKTGICVDHCSLEIVESIPTNLTYPPSAPKHTPTHEAWLDLLNEAEKSIRIASFYWTLRDSHGYPTGVEGQRVFDALVAAAERGVKGKWVLKVLVNVLSDLILTLFCFLRVFMKFMNFSLVRLLESLN